MESSPNIILTSLLISLAVFLIYHFIDNENDIVDKIKELIKCGKKDEDIYIEYRYQKAKMGFFKSIVVLLTTGFILWQFNKYVCKYEIDMSDMYDNMPDF
jgi:hypothetical protein